MRDVESEFFVICRSSFYGILGLRILIARKTFYSAESLGAQFEALHFVRRPPSLPEKGTKEKLRSCGTNGDVSIPSERLSPAAALRPGLAPALLCAHKTSPLLPKGTPKE